MAFFSRLQQFFAPLKGVVGSFSAKEEPSLEAQKRLQITRICALFLAILGPVFMVLNFLQNHIPLFTVNLLTTLAGVLCLYLAHRRKLYLAALAICVPLPPLFFTSSLLYKNGMEYILLLQMMGAIFMFNSRPTRVALCLFNGLGFLIIRILLFNPSDPGLPLGRYATNIIVFLIAYYCILELFRSININYQLAIIEKNLRLQDLTRELETANVAKEKIFRIVSHDMRGPIGNLQSTLSLVASRDLSAEDFRELLPQLQADLQGAGNCLDTLLHWSSRQLAHIQPTFTSVPLPDVWTDLQAQLRESFLRKGVKLESDIPAHSAVHADRDLLCITLRNLLSNALKFTPEGGRVRLEVEHEAGQWRTSICDTGIGISREQLEQILTPSAFHSTHGTEGERGMGLGLGICRELLSSLGSELQVSSQVNEGSCFYFVLPEAKPLPSTLLAQSLESVQKSTTSSNPRPSL